MMRFFMIQQSQHHIDDANLEILNSASYVLASIYVTVHQHFDDALFDDSTVTTSY